MEVKQVKIILWILTIFVFLCGVMVSIIGGTWFFMIPPLGPVFCGILTLWLIRQKERSGKL